MLAAHDGALLHLEVTQTWVSLMLTFWIQKLQVMPYSAAQPIAKRPGVGQDPQLNNSMVLETPSQAEQNHHEHNLVRKQ